jgi:hypothetical protein
MALSGGKNEQVERLNARMQNQIRVLEHIQASLYEGARVADRARTAPVGDIFRETSRSRSDQVSGN